MGWAFGTNEAGREVGYGVNATCDEAGCEEKIDRGLGHVCGGMHDGGDYGCGGYFCGKHLYGAGLCDRCKDNDACPDCKGEGWIGDLEDGDDCEACDGVRVAGVDVVSNLPILYAGGELAVIDPTTGEPHPVHVASDHALAHACEKVAELDRELREARQALAHELRDRHGVGTSHAGGYVFRVNESQSWPDGATRDALAALEAEGHITKADRERAMPSKPKPDARQLKALIGRLLVSEHPEAAKVLSDACTTSPPSVREVQAEAVTEEAA